MRLTIERDVAIQRSARVMQIEGIFDVQPATRSGETYEVDLPLDEREWHIGLIVGSSGSGKSTIAREAFGRAVVSGFRWPKDASLLDAFPKEMPIAEVTALLSSVGFSSPPLWLRPFTVLSNGEQMRVTLARMLAEMPDLAVMDEFTSVVDRVVAQVGAAAVAKAVRRRGSKFVAVTCHYDVEAWLEPDWVYRTDERVFDWGSLQRRPPVHLEIARVHPQAWDYFKRYHYLTNKFHPAAVCFVAYYEERPIAFVGVLPSTAGKGQYRFARMVVLPEYQGIGVASVMTDWLGRLYAGLGYRLTAVTALATMNIVFERSPGWICTRRPALAHGEGKSSKATWIKHATNRLTSGWRYIGPAMDADEAQAIMAKTPEVKRPRTRKVAA